MSYFGVMSEEDIDEQLVVVKEICPPSKGTLAVAKSMLMGRRWFGDGAQYAGMMHPNQFYGPFESGAPLATLEDMERRIQAVIFGAELTSMIRVHIHVVSAGLRGCDQDLLFEVVCSEFATKPIKTVIRISQGNTCVEPGSVPMFMSADLGNCIHNTEHSFVDGKVTTISRMLVPGRIPLSWAFPNVVLSPDTDTPAMGVEAAASDSGDSASASASAQPSGEVVFPVVRLVRPTSRNIVHRAIERYSRKTHVVNTDKPHEDLSYMYSNDVELRRMMWLPYIDAVRRPRGSSRLGNPNFKKWFLTK